MTVIAALRTGTSILMGSDSAAARGHRITMIGTDKVFIRGDYVFGVAGDSRIAGILRHNFSPPAKIAGLSWTEFMLRVFGPTLSIRLRQKDFKIPEDSAVLVGTKGGGIFTFGSDHYMSTTGERYAAIGSAEEFALGSLCSTSGGPRRRLMKALKAAAHLDAYVRPPFTVIELHEAGLIEQSWEAVSAALQQDGIGLPVPQQCGTS